MGRIIDGPAMVASWISPKARKGISSDMAGRGGTARGADVDLPTYIRGYARSRLQLNQPRRHGTARRCDPPVGGLRGTRRSVRMGGHPPLRRQGPVRLLRWPPPRLRGHAEGDG